MTWKLFFFQIFSDLKSRIWIAVFETVFSVNILVNRFSNILCCFAVGIMCYMSLKMREPKGPNKDELEEESLFCWVLWLLYVRASVSICLIIQVDNIPVLKQLNYSLIWKTYLSIYLAIYLTYCWSSIQQVYSGFKYKQ